MPHLTSLSLPPQLTLLNHLHPGNPFGPLTETFNAAAAGYVEYVRELHPGSWNGQADEISYFYCDCKKAGLTEGFEKRTGTRLYDHLYGELRARWRESQQPTEAPLNLPLSIAVSSSQPAPTKPALQIYTPSQRNTCVGDMDPTDMISGAVHGSILPPLSLAFICDLSGPAPGGDYGRTWPSPVKTAGTAPQVYRPQYGDIKVTIPVGDIIPCPLGYEVAGVEGNLPFDASHPLRKFYLRLR